MNQITKYKSSQEDLESLASEIPNNRNSIAGYIVAIVPTYYEEGFTKNLIFEGKG